MPSARDIAFIGCRLLALYVLYEALRDSIFGLRALFSALSGSTGSMTQLLLQASFQHALLITGLITAAIFWFAAGWISGKVVMGAPHTEGEWSPRTVLAVAVIFFGLCVIFWTLPLVSYVLQNLVADEAVRPATVASILLQGLIATGCIFGAQAVADFIARARRWSADRS